MVALKGKPKTDYTNVGIPKDMVAEIERIILSDKRLGFSSRQEFVKEAVRRSIVHYGGVGNTSKESNRNK